MHNLKNKFTVLISYLRVPPYATFYHYARHVLC